jgi:hypothetical protein
VPECTSPAIQVSTSLGAYSMADAARFGLNGQEGIFVRMLGARFALGVRSSGVHVEGAGLLSPDAT